MSFLLPIRAFLIVAAIALLPSCSLPWIGGDGPSVPGTILQPGAATAVGDAWDRFIDWRIANPEADFDEYKDTLVREVVVGMTGLPIGVGEDPIALLHALVDHVEPTLEARLLAGQYVVSHPDVAEHRETIAKIITALITGQGFLDFGSGGE